MTSIGSGKGIDQRMLAIALMFIVVVFSINAAAQAVPDLSGNWTLNRTASTMADLFSLAPAQIKIVQKGNDLVIERRATFQDREFTNTDKFTLDGKECINPGWSDSEKRSTAVWSAGKASLMITTKISLGDNGDETVVETFRLKNRQLIIETKGSSVFGETAETLVFDKK